MKMSITRALVELKRIDQQIDAKTVSGEFVAVTIGVTNKKLAPGFGSDTPENKAKSIQSSFDTILSLMEKRQRIKSAIVMSNAKTFVTLNNKTFSVAEAIEMKKSVAQKQQLLTYLKSQYHKCSEVVSKTNTLLDNQIDALLTNVYGADKSKVDPDSYNNVAKPQKLAKEAAILDPIKITERIKQIEEEVSLIESELDFTLSESNSRTEIEVD